MTTLFHIQWWTYSGLQAIQTPILHSSLCLRSIFLWWVLFYFMFEMSFCGDRSTRYTIWHPYFIKCVSVITTQGHVWECLSVVIIVLVHVWKASFCDDWASSCLSIIVPVHIWGVFFCVNSCPSSSLRVPVVTVVPVHALGVSFRDEYCLSSCLRISVKIIVSFHAWQVFPWWILP